MRNKNNDGNIKKDVCERHNVTHEDDPAATAQTEGRSAQSRLTQTLSWPDYFDSLCVVFILCTSPVCQSLSNCLPVWFSMRHKSHSATCASPPQSLLHPQNAINVQPSFILIHSPLAQMKWIRNLVGQGRACRLPSVAELFSILLASKGRERENESEKEAQ